MPKTLKIEKLIEKIEGEATLHFHMKEKKISFVDIVFASSRGIEQILQNKPALDALVINPRVCGICGHAHLIATVKALEDCYEDIEISNKAKIIRELTLNFEIIQNHFKWFYLTIMPLLKEEQNVMRAAKPSQLMSKAIAHLAGQYPHNSYAIVGGVVCDPTPMDMLKVQHLLQETIRFFEAHLVHGESEKLLVCEKIEELLARGGDLPHILNKIVDQQLQQCGKSFDRFIVFGENSYFQRGKASKTRIQPNISEVYLDVEANSNSLAKNVLYKQGYYEVGPLSRAMMLKTPLIKDAHRRFGDSLMSRILARVCETLQLLNHSLSLIKQIDLDEPSYIKPSTDIQHITGEGVGAVEAARGSLIHKVQLVEGTIKSYQLITPTQWNLSQGTQENPGVSQQAMLGLEEIETAELVFKSFDVCSVCTTH